MSTSGRSARDHFGEPPPPRRRVRITHQLREEAPVSGLSPERETVHCSDKLHYVARPPLALERLRRDDDGLMVHPLRRPFRDGTTELLFEPLDFFCAAGGPRDAAAMFDVLST